MKTFHMTAAQGELMFSRLPDDFKIPKGATRIDAEHGHVVIGHSETGHHHVMDDDCVTLYRLPDSLLECLLVVERPNELRHLRDFDTHESLAFEPGIYKVTTAREYTPEGWKRTID